jgi:hypothetical protein
MMTSSTSSTTMMTSSTSSGDDESGTVGSAGSDTEIGDDTAGDLDCEVVFVDTFETDVLDDVWSVTTYGDGAYVTLSNGLAVLSIPSSDNAWVIVRLEDLGGFEEEALIVEIEAVAADPNAYVWFNVNDGTKYEFGLIDDRLEVRAGVTAGNPPLLAEFPYDPDAHRFLRIQAVPSAVEWAVSASGMIWETLHAVPLGEPMGNPETSFGLGTFGQVAEGAEASFARFVRCK